MASARVLSTNELGTIRYQLAAIQNLWPIEVRLLPQSNDTSKTIYTLHTPGNLATPFTPTTREELRATLAVPPGALVYEVLRDGLLVSTGGLEVRQPQPIPDLQLQQQPPQLHQPPQAQQSTITTSTITSSSTSTTTTTSSSTVRDEYNNEKQESLSGAYQISVQEGSSPNVQNEWPVTFHYNEFPWTVRQVSVIEEKHDRSHGHVHDVKCILSRSHQGGFIGQIYLPVGVFHYRFKVVPQESLHMHVTSQPTRLGWDDGAMIHAWELVTWTLTIQVIDLSIPGTIPADALMRLEKLPSKFTTDISHIDDEDDEDDEDEIVIRDFDENLNDLDDDKLNIDIDTEDNAMDITSPIKYEADDESSKEDQYPDPDQIQDDEDTTLLEDIEITSSSMNELRISSSKSYTEEEEIQRLDEEEEEEEAELNSFCTVPTTPKNNNNDVYNIRKDERYESKNRKGIQKNQHRGGWPGLALNAAMFILGSTMTIMMGNASGKRRRGGGLPRDSMDSDDKTDTQSDDSFYVGSSRRPSWRKTMSHRFRKGADSDNESDVFSQRKNSSRSTTKSRRG